MESGVKCNVQCEGFGVRSDILNVDFSHGKNVSFDFFCAKTPKSEPQIGVNMTTSCKICVK